VGACRADEQEAVAGDRERDRVVVGFGELRRVSAAPRSEVPGSTELRPMCHAVVRLVRCDAIVHRRRSEHGSTEDRLYQHRRVEPAGVLGPQRRGERSEAVSHRKELKEVVRNYFPSHDASEEDAIVAAIESVLQPYLDDPDQNLDNVELEKGGLLDKEDRDHTYYLAHARHARQEAPNSEFIGHLPMVRIRLPVKDKVNVKTAMGVADYHDRTLRDLDDFQRQLRRAGLSWVPERADLITPVRSKGLRFAAVALYLGYEFESDAAPSCFVLEAGMALGWPMVTYPGLTMDQELLLRTFYEPTPFSREDHWYRGTVKMDGDHPDQVQVKVQRTKDSGPHIIVTVQYEHLAKPAHYEPAALIAGAGARVAAIGKAMGRNTNLPLEGLMAAIGRGLKWVRKPSHP
jgi:hypothetical protein